MLGLVPWLGHQFGTCHEVTSKTRVSSSDALVTTSSTTSKALVTTSEALVPSSFFVTTLNGLSSRVVSRLSRLHECVRPDVSPAGRLMQSGQARVGSHPYPSGNSAELL